MIWVDIIFHEVIFIMLRLLLKLLVSLFGIKFYQSDIEVKNTEVTRSVFKTFQDQEIKFLFYREIVEDILYRCKTFKKVNNHIFLIQLELDNGLKTPLLKFNKKKFSIKGHWLNWIPDDVLADVLLDIYLNYVKSELTKDHLNLHI